MGSTEAITGSTASATGLSRSEFARQFSGSYRVLWLIAASVTGDKSHADDVVQDAAMIALEKLDQFQPGTSFTAWMGQMVRFLALNEMRKRKGRRTVACDPGTMDQADPSGDPALRVGGRELDARGQAPPEQELFDDQLMQALQGIGETARACLLLRTVQDMEYSEIAKALDIPEGTAMSHVHRSRQVLRERLSALAPAGAGKGEAS